jgi:hypothetical protein
MVWAGTYTSIGARLMDRSSDGNWIVTVAQGGIGVLGEAEGGGGGGTGIGVGVAVGHELWIPVQALVVVLQEPSTKYLDEEQIYCAPALMNP